MLSFGEQKWSQSLSWHRKFRWHRSRCLLLAFSWFLGCEALKRKRVFATFMISSVVCWSPKTVTLIIFQSKVIRWYLCQSLFLENSWFLVDEALKRLMLVTTLFINSVVCWSPKMVTIIIFQSKVFRWHLCQSLLLANSWFLVYESLERIMFFTTLFIVSVVFWSTKMITVIILALEVSLTSFSLFAFSIFLISGLRSSEA